MKNNNQDSLNKINEFPSELRFDLITKDWVVIATNRGKRPGTFKKEKRTKIKIPQKECPFCQINSQKEPVLVFPTNTKNEKNKNNQKIPRNWTLVVIPNKFPAFLPYFKLDKKKEGPFYQTINAVGFHEVVVTRDHEKSMAQFSIPQIKEVIDSYHQRFLVLMKEKYVNYISIFHNHGIEAGASIVHPHSQIITTPLIDIDLKKALFNSKKYFQKTKKCIYCEMNEWERKIKKRLVFENEKFLAICPFASKCAFEVIISPKKHLSYFEQISENEKLQLAEIFKIVLNKIYKALNNPAYNFYLHTAPCDSKKYPYYHWHWTILPKTSTWAGFEIGTHMEISTISPEKSAEYLRKFN